MGKEYEFYFNNCRFSQHKTMGSPSSWCQSSSKLCRL